MLQWKWRNMLRFLNVISVTSHMAVEVLLLFSILSISSGNVQNRLLDLECPPAVGVIGESMEINCSFKASFIQKGPIIISTVSINKKGGTAQIFKYANNTAVGDSRFLLPDKNNPSLLITNTTVSDEGEYSYMVVTNRGIVQDRTFKISMIAKYNEPSISSWPEKIEDGGPVELYCNASGGYPAGTIHWFDSLNTNWTKTASLEVSVREDKLLHLSSKLTFTSIDSSWAPFKCVVLNSKFLPEGENTFQLKMTGDPAPHKSVLGSIVTGVLVIGFIIVGLLMALQYSRKRVQRHLPVDGTETDPEERDDRLEQNRDVEMSQRSLY